MFLSVSMAAIMQNSAVLAFDLWNPTKEACDYCGGAGTDGGVPLSELRDEDDAYVGCPPQPGNEGNDRFSTFPACSVVHGAENVQAGGHADTFHVLHDNKVAKQMVAFDDLSPETDLKEKRHQKASATEYMVYMNFWCLRKLKDTSRDLSAYPKALALRSSGVNSTQHQHPEEPRTGIKRAGAIGLHHQAEELRPYPGAPGSPHLFDPFVFGESPWAPVFFGICKVKYATSSTAYIVMENLMPSTGPKKYYKPSQLDLKVGRTIESNAIEHQGYQKVIKKQVADYVTPTNSLGARLAGYKVWDNENEEYKMMWAKPVSPLMSLSSVFEISFGERNWDSEDQVLATFSNQLEKMSLWWNDVGSRRIHSIALSLLFIYEGDDTPRFVYEGDTPRPSRAAPTLKMIDYAHFFAWDGEEDWEGVDRSDWPADLTDLGLTSAMGYMDNLIGDNAKLARKINTEKHKSFSRICSGSKRAECANGKCTVCSEKCPIVAENPHAKLKAFIGISQPRCQHLAVTAGMQYYSWRRRNHGECRICDAVVPRKTSVLIAPWSKGWDVYKADPSS